MVGEIEGGADKWGVWAKSLSSRTNAIWITVCGKSGLLRVHTY